MPFEAWVDALHLATLWKLDLARKYIIKRMTEMLPDRSLLERVLLADKYEVRQWLKPAYEGLCIRLEPPTLEECQQIDLKRVLALHQVREASRLLAIPVYHCKSCALADRYITPGRIVSGRRVCYSGHTLEWTRDPEDFREVAARLIGESPVLNPFAEPEAQGKND